MLSPDVDEDDGHVIRGPRVEGLLEKQVGRAPRGQSLREHLVRVRVVDDAAQAVRAQEPPVAGLGRHDERVDLGVRVHVSEDAHEHRAARVVARLLGGDAAGVDEALDERVVGRQLREGLVAVEVDAGVADVGDHGVVVDHDERGDGRPHSRELGALADRVDDVGRRRGDRLLQRAFGRAGRGEARVEGLEPRDREARGDIASRVPAHSVGHREEVGAGEAGVLIVGAHLPRVRECGA